MHMSVGAHIDLNRAASQLRNAQASWELFCSTFRPNCLFVNGMRLSLDVSCPAWRIMSRTVNSWTWSRFRTRCTRVFGKRWSISWTVWKVLVLWKSFLSELLSWTLFIHLLRWARTSFFQHYGAVIQVCLLLWPHLAHLRGCVLNVASVYGCCCFARMRYNCWPGCIRRLKMRLVAISTHRVIHVSLTWVACYLCVVWAVREAFAESVRH